MTNVFSGKRLFLDKVLGPLERLIYRICHIDEHEEQHWTTYTAAMLMFSLVGCLSFMGFRGFNTICRSTPRVLWRGPGSGIQHGLEFHYQYELAGYSGESTMSYLVQMAGLAFHNFVSAATGIALAIAFIRGIARRETKTLGNFWVDLTRTTLYVLLPFCIIGHFYWSLREWSRTSAHTQSTLVEPQQVEKTDDRGQRPLKT